MALLGDEDMNDDPTRDLQEKREIRAQYRELIQKVIGTVGCA